MRTATLFALPLLAMLAHCGAAPDGATTGDTADDEEGLSVADDDLNGLWVTTVDGKPQGTDSVLSVWSTVGVRLDASGVSRALTRSGDTLTGDGVSLDVLANGAGATDDALDGTVAGHAVHMTRDAANKPPIVLALPGDRPWRQFLVEKLAPAAQEDRESYTTMHQKDLDAFLHSCELYKHGSWQRTFMKGSTWSEQSTSFEHIVWAADGVKTTPRRILKTKKLTDAITANLKDPSQAALAMSTFGMYFSTGAGRGVRLPITNDSMAYFVTDRPARAERIGLSIMKTPLHGPLASTFGRQLLDMGAMPQADDLVYARSVMEMLAKSDSSRAAQLSAAGRSAITDWYAVMAIEDYRGVVFGSPDLGWGYDMTSVQFYGLVARALARPGQKDSAGNAVAAQVLVGSQLRPGDPSYADVLNGGNDMQEYGDMAAQKQLATQYLRAQHPQAIAAVEAAFANVVPKAQLDSRAQNDVFHYVCGELYDSQGRTKNLTGASATAAVEAVVNLFAILAQESAAFEAFILSHGYTKSNDPAPKSTGY